MINKIEESLKEELLNNLNDIYCYNCKFEEVTEQESYELYGYYGCDSCYRKNIGWEISQSCVNSIVEKVVNKIDKSKKEK